MHNYAKINTLLHGNIVWLKVNTLYKDGRTMSVKQAFRQVHNKQ